MFSSQHHSLAWSHQFLNFLGNLTISHPISHGWYWICPAPLCSLSGMIPRRDVTEAQIADAITLHKGRLAGEQLLNFGRRLGGMGWYMDVGQNGRPRGPQMLV